MVLGAAASRSVAASRRATAPGGGLEVPADAANLQPDGDALRSTVRRLMWKHVGLVRDGQGLAAALAEFERLGGTPAGAALPARDLLLNARLIASAALRRTESRGAHWRADHPNADPAQQQRRFFVPPPAPSIPLKLTQSRAA